jgi:RimJ/RimL family protein N-acetyltransferase
MTTRFPIRFTGLNRAMALLGLGPRRSWVEVDEQMLRVRMGWGFHLDVALAAVRDARLDDRPVWSWGVHGWRGRWLVNGSSSGIVRVDLEPPGHARTMGIPISVRELRVSVEDPAASPPR